jgi:hypothetical protein
LHEAEPFQRQPVLLAAASPSAFCDLLTRLDKEKMITTARLDDMTIRSIFSGSFSCKTGRILRDARAGRSWPPSTTAAIRFDAAAALFQTFEKRFGTSFCVCASFLGSIEGAPKKGITDIREFHCFVHQPNCRELQRFKILESYDWRFLTLNQSLRSRKTVATSAMPLKFRGRR